MASKKSPFNRVRSVIVPCSMPVICLFCFFLGVILLSPVITPAEEENTPPFRTDQGADSSLPWYQPVKGEFPPEGSAHYITGELIKSDHTERELIIRVDRNDSQQASHLDLPLLLNLLPYGSIYYNGAPAALQDIPLGTHLHTWCYLKAPDDQRPPIAVFHDRVSPESNFRQCLRIEDDFSYHASRNEVWRIKVVDLKRMKLTASLKNENGELGPDRDFDLTSATEVYLGNSFGSLESIEPGQEMLMNLTWATLYGPGRISRIWLDGKSRELASARQLEKHRNHIRERGVPGWIESVDDETQLVSVSLFDGIDTALFKDFEIIVPEPLGWPTSGGAKDDLKPKGTLAVARESLMTYDPLNDRKGGNLLETRNLLPRPGSSGVQIVVECDMLLEGYRPTEIVRFYPASWRVVALPLEEQFHGRE